MKPFLRPHRGRAFTLVEMLVATAIAVILIGIVLTISGRALTNSRQLTNAAVREADAQFAMEIIIADLEALVQGARQDGEVLAVTPEVVDGAKSTWLLLLTTAIDRDTGNYQDVARAVSYRLAYQNTIDGGSTDPAYALYRAVASAADSFESATGVNDLKVDFWDNPAANPPEPTGIASFMVGNVVAFEVRLLRADTGQWTTADDIVKLRTSEAKVQTVPVRGGLLAAEARLTVLSPQGAKLLQIGALTLADAIQRHGTTYSRQTARFPAMTRSMLLPTP